MAKQTSNAGENTGEQKAAATESTVKKFGGKVLDLRKRKVCIVTKEGNDFKHNKWKEGQEVVIGEVLANQFQERGLVKIKGDYDPKAKK